MLGRLARPAAALFAALVFSTAPPSWAAEGVAVLASGQRVAATTVAACQYDETSRSATLRIEGLPEPAPGLVRWGEPQPPAARPAVVLADGSRLMSDRPWSPTGLLRINAETVRLRRGKAWVEFPRDAVRWVVVSAEGAGIDLERLPEAPHAGDDTVYLRDGDRISGALESLTAEALTIRVAGEPIETPLESIAALSLSGEAEPLGDAAVLVGLADGSVLSASQLAVEGDRFECTHATGARFEGATDTLALLQPLGGPTRYLSDLEPVDYRHTPYLDLPWPLANDHGLLGGPLAGGGRRAAKGVAIHSAARLIYRLDGSAQRFRADLAVADPADDASAAGSVVFRVYLVRDGEFVSAYESDVVRGGDPALPIDVDTTGAAALALVVDYADNGDAGDHALWLDARLTANEL